MTITGEIGTRSFTNKDTGEVIKYYVLEVELFDGSKVDFKIPKDVARILVLSEKANRVLEKETD